MWLPQLKLGALAQELENRGCASAWLGPHHCSRAKFHTNMLNKSHTASTLLLSERTFKAPRSSRDVVGHAGWRPADGTADKLELRWQWWGVRREVEAEWPVTWLKCGDCSSGDREEGRSGLVQDGRAGDDVSESLSLSPPLKRCVVEDRETGLMLTDDDNGQRRIVERLVRRFDGWMTGIGVVVVVQLVF